MRFSKGELMIWSDFSSLITGYLLRNELDEASTDSAKLSEKLKPIAEEKKPAILDEFKDLQKTVNGILNEKQHPRAVAESKLQNQFVFEILNISIK